MVVSMLLHKHPPRPLRQRTGLRFKGEVLRDKSLLRILREREPAAEGAGGSGGHLFLNIAHGFNRG